MTSYSKYPNQLDDSTTLPVTTDNVTGIRAEVVNRIRDAILSIESELGINPSQDYGTIADRLDALRNQVVSFTNQIETLNTQLSTISSQIEDINEEIDNLSPGGGEVLGIKVQAFVSFAIIGIGVDPQIDETAYEFNTIYGPSLDNPAVVSYNSSGDYIVTIPETVNDENGDPKTLSYSVGWGQTEGSPFLCTVRDSGAGQPGQISLQVETFELSTGAKDDQPGKITIWIL